MEIEIRIRKLLALGERAGTEAEAQAAMTMAHKLLAQHNLDMATVRAGSEEKPEDIVTDKTTESKLSSTQPVDTIYGAVARLYFCKIYLSTRYNSAGEKERNICIMGRPSNIAVVKYIAAYVIRSMEDAANKQGREAAQAMADEGVTLNIRRWRASFRLGFALRIFQRVEEEIKNATAGQIKASDGRALVLAPVYRSETNAIAAYMNDQKLRLGRSRSSMSVRSSSGYEAGRAAANAASLRNNGLGRTADTKRIA